MRAKAAAVSPFFSGLYPDVFLTEKPRGIYGPTERIADKLDTITIEWNKSVEEKIYKRERTLVHIPPAAIYCWNATDQMCAYNVPSMFLG